MLKALFRRLGKTSSEKTEATPDPRVDAEFRLSLLRGEVVLARAAFFNAVLDAVAYDLESRELFEPLWYWSADRIGVPVADVHHVIEAALLHAEGVTRIDGLNYPFNEPKLVESLRRVRAAFVETSLDVPAALVPQDSQRANFAFGELVSQGVDPLVARERANESALFIERARKKASEVVGHRADSSPGGITAPRQEDRPSSTTDGKMGQTAARIPRGLTPVASHTPAAHPSLRRQTNDE